MLISVRIVTRKMPV